MIVVFGTICLDRVMRIPSLPTPGGYVEVLSEELMLGGEAANTANVLQAWGADYLLAGNALGGGFEGAELERLLGEKGLAHRHDHVRNNVRTPVCDVYVTDDAERTMIGRGFSVLDASVDTGLLPFSPGDWFTADPNMPIASREAVRRANDRGMRTYTMDFIGVDEPIYRDAVWQSSTDWVGSRGNVPKNLRFARDLHASTGATAIVTDGAKGLVVATSGMAPRYFPAFRADNFVDATGAGDAFRAGMLYGLDQDWPLLSCLRFGAAAGCLTCQVLGGAAYPPPLAEVEALMRSQSEVASAYSSQ
jgi:sugar/nucleoside kinase (ribokinase family)